MWGIKPNNEKNYKYHGELGKNNSFVLSYSLATIMSAKYVK